MNKKEEATITSAREAAEEKRAEFEQMQRNAGALSIYAQRRMKQVGEQAKAIDDCAGTTERYIEVMYHVGVLYNSDVIGDELDRALEYNESARFLAVELEHWRKERNGE